MIGVLLTVLVMMIIVYIIHLILTWLQLPEPINKIAYIILALCVILWLLQILGVDLRF